MAPATQTKPSFENLMLRVTPKLKEKLAETAKDEQVSQNTLMTASLFLSTLAWGKMPIVGPPDNLLAFLAEAERAAEADDLAYGAFNVADWEQVRPFIQVFADYAFISDFQHRIDSASRDTVAYRFEFTKLGAGVLPKVAWLIRILIDSKCATIMQASGPLPPKPDQVPQ